MKTLRAAVHNDDYRLQRVLAEIRTARCTNNDFLVKLQHVVVEPRPSPLFEATCLFALADCDLFNFIRERDAVCEVRLLELSRDAAKGLQYLHCLGIAHLDIKPENYLLKFGQLQLADFGSARSSSELLYEYSTLEYSAPELLAPPVDSGLHRLDAWSLGATVYFMAERRPAFTYQIGDELQLAQDVIAARYSWQKPDVPHWLKTLVRSLLKPCPEDRLDADQALAHLGNVSLSHYCMPRRNTTTS